MTVFFFFFLDCSRGSAVTQMSSFPRPLCHTHTLCGHSNLQHVLSGDISWLTGVCCGWGVFVVTVVVVWCFSWAGGDVCHCHQTQTCRQTKHLTQCPSLTYTKTKLTFTKMMTLHKQVIEILSFTVNNMCHCSTLGPFRIFKALDEPAPACLLSLTLILKHISPFIWLLIFLLAFIFYSCVWHYLWCC